MASEEIEQITLSETFIEQSEEPQAMAGPLAIVIPCHNEEENLPQLLGALEAEAPTLCADYLDGQPILCILVDDGSTDGTCRELRNLASQQPYGSLDIHYISFSRNFGKEAAIHAGLAEAYQAGCQYFVVMDADLQDPPSLLPTMFEKLQAGQSREVPVDVVATYRENRKGEPPLRSAFSHGFYKLFNRFSEVKLKEGARDYRLMIRRVVGSILSLPEALRFSKGLFAWVGFETEWIPYQNTQRKSGKSSWSFGSLAGYGLQGILSFSTRPLEVLSIAGLSIVGLSILMLIVIIVRAFCFGDPVAGWPSLVCIIIFFSGMQLLAVAIAGMYITRIYGEVKHRPLYIIREED